MIESGNLDISFSLCGPIEQAENLDIVFEMNSIGIEMIVQDPEWLESPNLVVKFLNFYYS